MRIKSLIVIILSLYAISLEAQDMKATKSNLTVREWNIDAGSNQKVLDHLTIYNENGKKVERLNMTAKGRSGASGMNIPGTEGWNAC